MEPIHLIIKDVRAQTQKVMEVSPNITVNDLINEIQSNGALGLSYQNIILENNRPLSYYKFSDYTILYTFPRNNPATNILSQMLPHFAETSQNGDLLIHIENLINQNAELLENLQTVQPVNFRIQIRRRTGNNSEIVQEVESTTNANGTTSSIIRETTSTENRPNIIHYDTQARRDLETLLNSELFRNINRRSQQQHFDPQYNVDYNSSMLFVQSWLNVISQNLGRTQHLLESFSNLLNNPRIVLSQNSFNQIIQLLRSLSLFVNNTTSVMEREYNQRRDQRARRIHNEEIGGNSLRMEECNDEEELLWESYEEVMRENAIQRDNVLMQEAIDEINPSTGYHLNVHGRDIVLNENTSLHEINQIVEDIMNDYNRNE